MGAAALFTAFDQKDDESRMLENDSSTSSDVVVLMDGSSSVDKGASVNDFVIGHRPTSSFYALIRRGNDSTLSTGPNQKYCCFGIVCILILFAIMVYVFAYIISEKFRHKG